MAEKCRCTEAEVKVILNNETDQFLILFSQENVCVYQKQMFINFYLICLFIYLFVMLMGVLNSVVVRLST